MLPLRLMKPAHFFKLFLIQHHRAGEHDLTMMPSVTPIDRGETNSILSTSLLSWNPSHEWLQHHWVLNLQSPNNRFSAFLLHHSGGQQYAIWNTDSFVWPFPQISLFCLVLEGKHCPELHCLINDAWVTCPSDNKSIPTTVFDLKTQAGFFLFHYHNLGSNKDLILYGLIHLG